jgi:hypothetical protein
MTYPDDPVSFPSDPHPVRPGTSDALFARTIDATQQPPLVRAQETVATAIPRLTASLSDPLFLATLAGTLVLMWFAMRMRSQLRPVLLATLLMVTLTSFRPVQNPVASPFADDDMIARGYERARRFERPETSERPDPRETPDRRERREVAPPSWDPAPFAWRVPTRPDKLRPNRERIRQDEEELREAIEELRQRIEAELRRRGEHRYYQTRAARWIRRLPPELREWFIESQRAVASLDRDH